MKPLEKQFTKLKYVHKQVKRSGDVAIFERWHEDLPGSIHYEVVRIHKDPDRTIAGVLIKARERYPGANEWGVNGFSYMDRASAEHKFADLSA